MTKVEMMKEAIKKEYIRIRNIEDGYECSHQMELFNLKLCRVQAEGIVPREDIAEIREWMAQVRLNDMHHFFKQVSRKTDDEVIAMFKDRCKATNALMRNHTCR